MIVTSQIHGLLLNPLRRDIRYIAYSTTHLIMLFTLICLVSPISSAQILSYKVMLVGNDSYINFPQLGGTPIKDVDAMYQVLVGLGIAEANITPVKNLNYQEFLTALLNFRAGLKKDDAVLFYFSGHGFSIDGDDYLAPVDFSFDGTKDSARRKSIGLTQVFAYLSNIKSRVVVLDACRTDAPRLKKMDTEPSRLDFDPLLSTRSSGSLIAYSTSQGKTSDARSPSGLSFYTQYLVNSLAARPTDMSAALQRAKSATADASGGRQVPAVYDEMDGDFLFPATPSIAQNPNRNRVGGPKSSGQYKQYPQYDTVASPPDHRPSGAPITFDLDKDWKEGGNPNGQWSFRQGLALLSYTNALPNLGPGVAGGYAPNGGFIPAVFQAVGSHGPNPEDFSAGDIVTHCVGTGDGATNGLLHIDWTAKVAGTISISGSVWYGMSEQSRENHFSLRLNDHNLITETLSLKSGYSRSSPKTFTGLNGIKVSPGDKVSVYFSAQGYGSFAGVKETIIENPSN